MDTRLLLHDVADRAADWLGTVSDRPIEPDRTLEELEVAGTLQDAPLAVEQVIAELVEQAEPGLLAINSPRFFGFVTCYPSATTWRGRRCIRLSVCNWQTTAQDVDRSIQAIAAASSSVGHL